MKIKPYLISMLVAGLLYLGAIGPLACLEWHGVALNSGLYDVSAVAYRPVNAVCERSEWLNDSRNAWRRLWTTDFPW